MNRMEVILKIQDETKKLNLTQKSIDQVRDVTLILAMLVDDPLELHQICLNVLTKVTIIDSAEKDLLEYIQEVRDKLDAKRSKIREGN